MISLAFLIPVVALVWLLDRRDRRAHQERVAVEAARVQASPDLAALIALADRLCQRLQAPEQAVMEHAMQAAAPSPEPVSMFSDEQYWESKEQLAERAMREELNGATP